MSTMQARSPHHSDVFSHLPVALVRELDTPAVAQVLDDLVAAGWRTGQLRSRVGSAASQGSHERDAAHLADLLHELLAQTPPDVAHAREVQQRERARAQELAQRPVPAAPEVRQRALAEIRAGLRGAPARRPEPEPRPLPACSLCDDEGSWFVTREVRLCRRCISVLATGEARLSSTG